jgi:hypothetical protein
MRNLRKSGMLVLAVLAVAVLGGCNTYTLLFGEEVANPQDVLIGRWTIEGISVTGEAVGDYHAIEFLSDDTFEISTEDGTVFERNTMASITDESFDCTIVLQTNDPSMVGSENYAEYIIRTRGFDTVLRVDFYDDSTMETRFIRIIGKKQ